MTAYFAYGANLDPMHMAARCPGATLRGPAVLPDREFRIAAAGYGHAAVMPGREVHGVLWELAPGDEQALDEFEGVAEGLYRKDFATVRVADGGEVRAMLYLPADPAAGVPRPGYLERVIEVAEQYGFPSGYVQRLRRLLADSSDPAKHPY